MLTATSHADRGRHIWVIGAFAALVSVTVSCTDKAGRADVNDSARESARQADQPTSTGQRPERESPGDTPQAAQAGRYLAYSLKAAQRRIEQAGQDWRRSEPEVASLGGMTRIAGFVFDRTSGDLVLAGQKEPGRTALTLDDLVVALRASFCHVWQPTVNIYSAYGTESSLMQYVEFDGGITDTAFGQALFDACQCLRELSMGLTKSGTTDMPTLWDRAVERLGSERPSGPTKVSSFFALRSINPYVAVREGVGVVHGLKAEVGTSLLGAEINGKPATDVKEWNTINDVFAHDLSRCFEDWCRAHVPLNRLRGLQELVSISAAVAELDEGPDLSYWLDTYRCTRSETPRTTKALRRSPEGNRGWLEVSGAIRLMALPMRLSEGDMTGFREGILRARPSADTPGWSWAAGEWITPAEPGPVQPEDAATLLLQASCRMDDGRYADAASVFDKVRQLNPGSATAHLYQGAALAALGRQQDAWDCYGRALEIKPRFAVAWYNRGVLLRELGRLEDALECYDRAVQLNPRYLGAWLNAGAVSRDLGRLQEAVECADKALAIDPRDARAWTNKSVALTAQGRLDEALECCNRALEINSQLCEAWLGKGAVLKCQGQTEQAMRCCDEALQIDGSYAEAWYNKGVYTGALGRMEEGMRYYRNAVGLDPKHMKAWHNGGVRLYGLEQYEEAYEWFEKALELGDADARPWLAKIERLAEPHPLPRPPVSSLYVPTPPPQDYGAIWHHYYKPKPASPYGSAPRWGIP